MFDYAMSGIVKSNYASANLTYNVKIAEGTIARHRLGAGFGAIYGNRHVDFSRLDFEEQFTAEGAQTAGLILSGEEKNCEKLGSWA